MSNHSITLRRKEEERRPNTTPLRPSITNCTLRPAGNKEALSRFNVRVSQRSTPGPSYPRKGRLWLRRKLNRHTPSPKLRLFWRLLGLGLGGIGSVGGHCAVACEGMSVGVFRNGLGHRF